MLLIEDIFLPGLLILAIGCAAAFFRKAKLFQILFWGGVYLYALIVLGLTLFPIPYQGVEDFMPVPHNFIPFYSISSTLERGVTSTSLLQIGGNILLSVPYGAVLDVTIREKKGWRFFLLPFLFPLAIESLQLFIGFLIGLTYRSFDVDDFILNLFGAYLGIAFSKIFLKKYGDQVYHKLFPKKC